MIENERIEEMMFELEEKAENTLNALDRDYGAIRTGRANPPHFRSLRSRSVRRYE